MTTACVPCSLEYVDPTRVVFRSALWACEIFPGFEVPGWYVLRVRRHASHLWGLTAEEAAAYGTCLRNLAGAMSEALAPEALYTVSFGENHPHFHSLVIARGADVTDEYRSANILALRDSRIDIDAADATRAAVARAYRGTDDSRLARGRWL